MALMPYRLLPLEAVFFILRKIDWTELPGKRNFWGYVFGDMFFVARFFFVYF